MYSVRNDNPAGRQPEENLLSLKGLKVREQRIDARAAEYVCTRVRTHARARRGYANGNLTAAVTDTR